ncbi:MAG TPA: DUF3108 domain-containing protein [Ignavibacteria bacterium]
MKKLFIILICLVSFSNVIAVEKVLEVGEELTYKVYYHFIKLGEVNLKITDKDNESDYIVYSAIASIKTYEGVPFVSLNYKFLTKMYYKNNEIYSLYFNSTEFKKKSAEAKYNSLTITDYYFEHDDNFIKLVKQTDMVLERDDTLKYEKLPKFQDGLSVFYNARVGSLKPKPYRVPIYMNEEESNVNYSFNMNEDVVSIESVDYDISTIKIQGIALFKKAIFGLTGDFTGWLSKDDDRIPLKAQFNVVIGKITMELSSYKKTGWKPPKYQN